MMSTLGTLAATARSSRNHRLTVPMTQKEALEKMLEEFGSLEHRDCKCRQCDLVRAARKALKGKKETA